MFQLPFLSSVWPFQETGITKTMTRGIVRRVVITTVLVFTFFIFLFISQYLRDHFLTLYWEGYVLEKAYHSTNFIEELESDPHYQVIIERLELVGMVFTDGSEAQDVWFVEGYDTSEVIDDIHLGEGMPFNYAITVLRSIFSSGEGLIGVINPDIANVKMIVPNRIVKQQIGWFYFRTVLYVAIGLAINVMILHYLLTRQLSRNISNLFSGLYGQSIVDKKEKNNQDQEIKEYVEGWQEVLKHHIDEQARLASLGAGTSRLVHDVRNLLASLVLVSDRLQMMGEEEKKLGKRMSVSINQALSLCDWAARYTSAKRQVLNVDEYLLRDIVDEVLSFVHFHDPQNLVQLENNCSPDIKVICERTLLFRVIYNLSLNAAQAMQARSKGGRLYIHALTENDQTIISIIDNGPGIPPESRGYIMSPHEGIGSPEGTGLGILIAIDLISWHRGKINLVKTDKNGTHFDVILPFDKDAITISEKFVESANHGTIAMADKKASATKNLGR